MAKATLLFVVTCLGVALGFAGSAHAQIFTYSITGGGGQAQIGDGLPIPIQLATTGGVGTCVGTMGTPAPIGTGTKFPGDCGVGELLVSPNIGATIMQQIEGAGLPFRMTVPPGRFSRLPSGYLVLGVVPNNPKVFQVRTNLSLMGPGVFNTVTPSANTMGARAYGRTSTFTTMDTMGNTNTIGTMGGANTTTFMGAPSMSSFITYRNTSKRFGGPSQTRVIAKSDAWVWVNALEVKPPCMALAFGGSPLDPNDSGCFGPLLIANPGETGAAGGPVLFNDQTTPPFAQSPGVAQLSITATNGTIKSSKSFAMTASVRNTASSFGFPWTVGMITLKQTEALGLVESFKLTGMDGRNSYGVGTLSFVSGSLSDRALSGPNANRGWARYELPEPKAWFGLAAALGVLFFCHTITRGRR